MAYGLFEAVNDYNQHGYYLRFFWPNKPTLHDCAEAMGWSFPDCGDEAVLKTVALFKGETINISDNDYMVKELKHGKVE